MIRFKKDRFFSRLGRALAAIGVLALACILGWTLWTLPPFSDQMLQLVSSNMAFSGVENPVTAVLLNFRGYDTLLEIGVLLAAAVGVLSVGTSAAMRSKPAPSSILILFLRLLLPFIILVSGYILWIGKYAPGGAFQAGALLAAGAILFATAAVRESQLASKAIPLAMGIGLLIFLSVALATMMLHGNYLQYPVDRAGSLILMIEAAATISIAVILTLLFLGEIPVKDRREKDNNRKTFDFEEEQPNP
jgi:multisubunit Na+/H+ antiporter MnhB subunit